MIGKTAIAAFGLAAAAFALPAAAQMSARNAYVGASVGQAKYNDWCSVASEFGSSSCDDKDTTFRIFAGYQVHPNIGVELGYANLGEAKFSGTFAGLPLTGKDEFTAWDLVAVGSWRSPRDSRHSASSASITAKWKLRPTLLAGLARRATRARI